MPQPPQKSSRLPGPPLYLRLASRWFAPWYCPSLAPPLWTSSQSLSLFVGLSELRKRFPDGASARAGSNSISLRCTRKIWPDDRLHRWLRRRLEYFCRGYKVPARRPPRNHQGQPLWREPARAADLVVLRSFRLIAVSRRSLAFSVFSRRSSLSLAAPPCLPAPRTTSARPVRNGSLDAGMMVEKPRYPGRVTATAP